MLTHARAFADDFEDEYESEDEVMEAGVDGRPDAEREAEARGIVVVVRSVRRPTDNVQMPWNWTRKNRHLSRAGQYCSRVNR